MFKRLRPLSNAVTRRLGREQGLEAASVETVVVQPEEVETYTPPACLPGQIAKATASVPGHSSLEEEMERATATRMVHAPVIRYTLPDCLVHPAGVDFPGGSFRIHPLRAGHLMGGRIRRLSNALYCMTGVSHEYFGHWLQDACATALLKREGEALLLAERSDWLHASQYVQAFGFQPEPFDLLRVDRLTLYQDMGQGSNKRRRCAELRRRLGNAFPDSAGGDRPLYLRRGASGVSRLVANEDQVVAALETRGFDLLDLEGASVRDLFRRTRDAKFVVSMDGSHLNHLYFSMRPGAGLMTFVPADRFTMNQVGYAAASGLRLGFMVVDPSPNGYRVSIADLHATLDLMGE